MQTLAKINQNLNDYLDGTYFFTFFALNVLRQTPAAGPTGTVFRDTWQLRKTQS